jgi:hypothetical protein
VALFELRRLRILGAGDGDGRTPQTESLRVFQEVAEIQLRRPLKPDELRALVGTVPFQMEFFSGREFGVRVRGTGIQLLHKTREVLQALAAGNGTG